MKKILLFVFMTAAISAGAQNNNKFDVKFGVGTSLLGTGDMQTVTFENEINYNINHYFSTSFTVNYGKSFKGVYESTSYIQGNLNIFVSPFGNHQKNDFKIGTGFSVMNVADSYNTEEISNGNGQENTCRFDKRTSTGVNVIIENDYHINNRYMVGLKVFTQPYFNSDINSGVLLKFGVGL